MSRLKMLFRDRRGFTLIEIMMVLLLVAILAGLGITQFTNFSKDARDNTLRANLKILRNAIATQHAQMRLRCNITTAVYPGLTEINANSMITAAGDCIATEITNSADAVFVSGGIPVNSWGNAQSNTVFQCTAGGCTTRGTACVGGAARANGDDGWCYDVATGQIWPNSGRNDGAGAGSGNEFSY